MQTFEGMSLQLDKGTMKEGDKSRNFKEDYDTDRKKYVIT